MTRLIIEGKENFKNDLKKYESVLLHSYWSEMQQRGYIEIKK